MKLPLKVKIFVIVSIAVLMALPHLGLAQDPIKSPRKSATCMAVMKLVGPSVGTPDLATDAALRVLKANRTYFFRAPEAEPDIPTGFATHDHQPKYFDVLDIASRIAGIETFKQQPKTAESDQRSQQNQIKALTIRGEKEIHQFLNDFGQTTHSLEAFSDAITKKERRFHRWLSNGIAAALGGSILILATLNKGEPSVSQIPAFGITILLSALIPQLIKWQLVRFLDRDAGLDQKFKTLKSIAQSKTPNEWAYLAGNRKLSMATVKMLMDPNFLDLVAEIQKEDMAMETTVDLLAASIQLDSEAVPLTKLALNPKTILPFAIFTAAKQWVGYDFFLKNDAEGTPELIVVLRYSLDPPRYPRRKEEEAGKSPLDFIRDRLPSPEPVRVPIR